MGMHSKSPWWIPITPKWKAVTLSRKEILNYTLVSVRFILCSFLILNLGECNIHDCEDIVRAFYSNYSLSHVESKLKEKIEAYSEPQDDTFRNKDYTHGKAFNEKVKKIAKEVECKPQLLLYY